MLKIYGMGMSTCTRKVLMTCEELGIPYALENIDFGANAHKKEPHLSRQPFGRIPTIDDEGFTMFESRAICRYLNDKVSGSMVPKDIKARGVMEQFISIESSEFSGHAMKFIYEHVFQRVQEAGVIEKAGVALDVTCGVLDKRLASSAFLAGETFSLADICYMPYLEYAMTTPAKEVFGKHKNVMSWWNKISERPTWRKVTGKA